MDYNFNVPGYNECISLYTEWLSNISFEDAFDFTRPGKPRPWKPDWSRLPDPDFGGNHEESI
jgi:hypothetical protein